MEANPRKRKRGVYFGRTNVIAIYPLQGSPSASFKLTRAQAGELAIALQKAVNAGVEGVYVTGHRTRGRGITVLHDPNARYREVA